MAAAFFSQILNKKLQDKMTSKGLDPDMIKPIPGAAAAGANVKNTDKVTKPKPNNNRGSGFA